MLAKQVWRLVEDKTSLFHRFFKEKFFPKGYIFTTKEGSGSFARRSILKGREVIKKGAQWRVRNGESILIYQDKWLPNPQCNTIQSPLTFFGCDVEVSVLIDNKFLAHKAEVIKSIPLCFTGADDKLYWPSKVDRAYSVKAGYRLLVEDELSPSVGPLPTPHP